MAPELPGALEIARTLVSRGVVVSAGHSMATIDDTHKAVENGYTAATHLFNAMPPLDHRSPGLAAAVLLDDRITTGLIPDGLHVHPDMVDLAWRLKGPDQIVLITDAVGALGIQPGIFVQGGMEIVVDGHSARLRNGTLGRQYPGIGSGAAKRDAIHTLTDGRSPAGTQLQSVQVAAPRSEWRNSVRAFGPI